MKNLISKFSNMTRAISVISLLAIIASILTLSLAYDEHEPPTHAESEPAMYSTPMPAIAEDSEVEEETGMNYGSSEIILTDIIIDLDGLMPILPDLEDEHSSSEQHDPDEWKCPICDLEDCECYLHYCMRCKQPHDDCGCEFEGIVPIYWASTVCTHGISAGSGGQVWVEGAGGWATAWNWNGDSYFHGACAAHPNVTFVMTGPQHMGTQGIVWPTIAGYRVIGASPSGRVWCLNLVPIQHTVRFEDYEGEHIVTRTVNWGTDAEAPPDESKEGHTFDGWRNIISDVIMINFNNIRSNLTVRAAFTINTHTVRFENYDGEYLGTDTVDWGTGATAPDVPPRLGHTFFDWDTEFDDVREDITVVAQFTPDPYFVIFLNYDGSVHDRQTVLFGSTGRLPNDPARYGYTFIGWDRSDFTIRAERNLTVNPLFQMNTYTVTFVDWNDVTLYAETVAHGSVVIPQIIPVRNGYTFSGWQGNLEYITSDTIIKATYTLIPIIQEPEDDAGGSSPRPGNNHEIIDDGTGPNGRMQNNDSNDSREETRVFEVRDVPETHMLPEVLQSYEEDEHLPQRKAPLFTFMGRDVYFFADFWEASWALVNLLLTAFGILLTVRYAILAIKRKRRAAKSQALTEDEPTGDDFYKNIKWFAIGAAVSLIAIVLFAITQDLAAIIALLDYWTIAHTALIIAQVVVYKIFRNKAAKIDIQDTQGDETEVTDIFDEETDIADDKTVT